MKMRTALLFLILLLSGCGIMPGMQNPDTSRMKESRTLPAIPVTPTLIQITPSLVASQPTANYIYHVAPADVLAISVWQHPELSPQEAAGASSQMVQGLQRSAGQQGFLVNSRGYIYFPLVGHVHVAGKSIDTIRHTLTTKLKKYIKHPELNVRVADFRGRKIYVLGEVKKPGLIALNDQPLSITDAIVMAGGFDPNAADPSHIYVIHGRVNRPEVFWLNANTPDALLLAEHFDLKPGDIVFVSSAPAARWNRVINQLLPTLQTVWYTNAIIRSDY